jgi:hypothetical protein
VDREAVRGHILLLVAIVSGIAGMGMVYQGIAAGSVRMTSQGVPFLLIGVWWAGRELGRSIIAGRIRKSRR